MGKYIVIKNADKNFVSNNGHELAIPKLCEYSIAWQEVDTLNIVFNIPDYFNDSFGIAKGTTKLLNQGKIILPLKI